jgi:hypothetical protein
MEIAEVKTVTNLFSSTLPKHFGGTLNVLIYVNTPNISIKRMHF